MKTSVAIQGMHCNACVRLTEAFTNVQGVISAHVSLSPLRAEIVSSNSVSMDALDSAAHAAGNYSVVAETSGSNENPASSMESHGSPQPSLYPLVLIVLFIAGTAVLTTSFRAGWSWHTFMYDFMAGFFLVFSFFKLLDLHGFADAYQSYDTAAKKLYRRTAIRAAVVGGCCDHLTALSSTLGTRSDPPILNSVTNGVGSANEA